MERPRFLKISKNFSIFYRVSVPDRDTKADPALILIHGVASNNTRWSEFLQKTSLKSYFRIIRLDLRGHAESQTDTGVGMKNWCKDLVAILDQEQVGSAYIVGHSLGAQVALNFADRYAARVAGLVLIDPIVPSALRGYMAFGPYVRWLLIGFSIAASFWRRLFYRSQRFPLRDLFELDKKTRTLIADDPSANLADLYHSPADDMQHISVANYVRDICEVLRPLPSLKNIRTPTLALLARDPSISDGNRNRRTMRLIPGIKIETIDADHWPLTEKPDETREAIERWCLERTGEKIK